MTPIAAHTLAVRPLVVPATYRVVIEPMEGWADDLLVSFDGQTGTTLAPGDTVDVRRADHRVCLIRLGGDGFFSRMRRSCTGRSVGARGRCRDHRVRVRDLATIADVTLQLGPGLNVLTGETGAGKSMLVDALPLLLGERAASGSVRPGAAKLIVEGAFEGVDAAARRRIEDLGLDLDETAG